MGSDAQARQDGKKAVISIHAPRVGSDAYGMDASTAYQISIHAPRVGSDVHKFVDKAYYAFISIHAPRVGSDLTVIVLTDTDRDFNPRSPCGERPTKIRVTIKRCKFQSTLPVWGATEKREQ